jgi:glycerol-3-phosphate acyltransferase PlsY
MSIWFKKKGKYYSISFLLIFPIIGICVCAIISFAILFPTYCLFVIGLIIAIAFLFFLRHRRNGKRDITDFQQETERAENSE